MVRGHRKNGDCSDVAHNGQTVWHVGYWHEADMPRCPLSTAIGGRTDISRGPFDSVDAVENEHRPSAHGERFELVERIGWTSSPIVEQDALPQCLPIRT
jgi:hypothetical protein